MLPSPPSLQSLDSSTVQTEDPSATTVQLNVGGLIIDDVHSIRILDPQITRTSEQLRAECSGFVEKIQNFDSEVSDHLGIIGRVAAEVDRYRISSIGIQNQLESVSKQRETQRLQLQALILEKSMELERLRVQNNSLQKTESEQQDIINEVLSHK